MAEGDSKCRVVGDTNEYMAPDDYPPKLGPPPWTVFFQICVDLSGRILNWEVRVHHWLEGLLFMKNVGADHGRHRTGAMVSSNNGESLARVEPNDDDEDSEMNDGDEDVPAHGRSNADIDRNGGVRGTKRRQRANSECYWLPICRIDNFYNWRAAVKMWYLWTTSRIRGVPQRGKFGLQLYLHYKERCLRWNAGRRIQMAVIPYSFGAIRTRLLQAVAVGEAMTTNFIAALINDAHNMPVISADDYCGSLMAVGGADSTAVCNERRPRKRCCPYKHI